MFQAAWYITNPSPYTPPKFSSLSPRLASKNTSPDVDSWHRIVQVDLERNLNSGWILCGRKTLQCQGPLFLCFRVCAAVQRARPLGSSRPLGWNGLVWNLRSLRNISKCALVWQALQHKYLHKFSDVLMIVGAFQPKAQVNEHVTYPKTHHLPKSSRHETGILCQRKHWSRMSQEEAPSTLPLHNPHCLVDCQN